MSQVEIGSLSPHGHVAGQRKAPKGACMSVPIRRAGEWIAGPAPACLVFQLTFRARVLCVTPTPSSRKRDFMLPQSGNPHWRPWRHTAVNWSITGSADDAGWKLAQLSGPLTVWGSVVGLPSPLYPWLSRAVLLASGLVLCATMAGDEVGTEEAAPMIRLLPSCSDGEASSLFHGLCSRGSSGRGLGLKSKSRRHSTLALSRGIRGRRRVQPCQPWLGSILGGGIHRTTPNCRWSPFGVFLMDGGFGDRRCTLVWPSLGWAREVHTVAFQTSRLPAPPSLNF